MRTATKIAAAALQGVVVAAALGAAAIFVVPRLLGWQTVTVMSGSMAPAYAVDAVLAIDSVNPTEIRVGDVIAFETEVGQPMTTHRVMAVEHDDGGLAFLTKGDANEDPDSTPVAASAVRGRVVFGVPYLGAFVRAIRNPVGFALLFVLPAILLIGQEILTIRRDRRAKKAVTTPWPLPLAADAVGGPEVSDSWTTTASDTSHEDNLEHEVHV